jgi:Uma2 family endonuclease
MPSTAARSRSASSASVLPQRRFTQEEYFAMAEAGIFDANDSVELIDGHVVEMPAENKPHRVAIAKGTDVFVRALAERPYFLQGQSTLPLDELNVPEPDLAVLRGAPDDVLEGEPEVVLVVEVADTSLERDRSAKQALYAQQGIAEYWILNLRTRTLEVYWEPGESEYRQRRTQSEDETVTPRFEDAPSFDVEALLPARS